MFGVSPSTGTFTTWRAAETCRLLPYRPTATPSAPVPVSPIGSPVAELARFPPPKVTAMAEPVAATNPDLSTTVVQKRPIEPRSRRCRRGFLPLVGVRRPQEGKLG